MYKTDVRKNKKKKMYTVFILNVSTPYSGAVPAADTTMQTYYGEKNTIPER